MKNIYQESGYLNFNTLYDDVNPFVFCIGARGVGKTFGALQYCIDNGIKFIYLRSRAEQIKKLSGEALNPFKAINNVLGYDIRVNNRKTNGITQVLRGDDIIGYMLPLSTFHSFRGFDLSDVDCIIYDEFIPEKSEKVLKEQAEILFNAYESVNRNRELSGRHPVKLICLSNANNIFNDLFLYLKITKKVYDMVKKKQLYYCDVNRKMSIYCLFDSPISEKKKNTVLYQITLGTEFEEMAISNEFAIENEHLLKAMNISGFSPVANIGEIYIYSNSDNIYYITTFKKGVFKRVYTFNDTGKASFRRNQYSLWLAFLENRIYFEDIYCLEMFNLIY